MEIKVGEIWKDITDFPNYQISNYGRVKSKARITNVGIKNVKEIKRKEKILKPLKLTKGYLGIKLYNNTFSKTFKIHRLVAETFIPNLNNLPQVNHIDGNKQNNYVDNLEWISNLKNQRHAIKNGLIDLELRKNNMSKLGKSKKGIKARWKIS